MKLKLNLTNCVNRMLLLHNIHTLHIIPVSKDEALVIDTLSSACGVGRSVFTSLSFADTDTKRGDG